MSDSHTHGAPGSPNPLEFSKEVDKPGSLLVVYAAVIGLSLASVGLSSLGLGKLGLPLQLIFGTIQASLVGYYFMHLKQGDKVVILTAFASIFWMGILFTLFLADYATRGRVVGW